MTALEAEPGYAECWYIREFDICLVGLGGGVHFGNAKAVRPSRPRPIVAGGSWTATRVKEGVPPNSWEQSSERFMYVHQLYVPSTSYDQAVVVALVLPPG